MFGNIQRRGLVRGRHSRRTNGNSMFSLLASVNSCQLCGADLFGGPFYSPKNRFCGRQCKADLINEVQRA